MDNKKVFLEMRMTHNAVSAYLNRQMHCEAMGDMTMLHGRIIKHLCDHDQEDVYQRDIEALLAVRRSTATAILKCMEKNGLITRISVSSDARLKKICLTDRARSINQFISSQIEEAESWVRRGIPDTQLEQFFAVLEKIRENLKTAE